MILRERERERILSEYLNAQECKREGERKGELLAIHNKPRIKFSQGREKCKLLSEYSLPQIYIFRNDPLYLYIFAKIHAIQVETGQLRPRQIS